MPQLTPGLAATFAAQVIGATVMALLLLGFQRQYRKAYLRHWTLGWAALAAYNTVTALSLVLVGAGLSAVHPLRIAITLLGGISGYLEIGWFLFGMHELVRRRPVRMLDERRLVVALIGVGILSTLPFITSGPASGGLYAARISIRAAIGAIGFFFAAATLWRARPRRNGIGVTILGTAFFFFGLQEVQYAVARVSWLVAGAFRDYATTLGYLDFLLQSLMAIGMIACLLEDEREAAELAANEIEHLAYHDALTGLPNRPLFIDRLIVALAQAHRSNHRLAVFFLDLDRFKDINDSLGHSVGDQLLKEVAARIRRCVRQGDTVARFGGDEFTLLIPRFENIEEAAKVAQKVIETLRIPFEIQERELFVTTSVGISLYPSDGLDAETLVRNADTAMYRAKESGRDNYQLYAPAMNARALERLALENMLRKALVNDELVLFYQPLVDVATRAVIGVEALLRWQHPELGLLSPAHFISVAELSGLIIPIGEWVLQTACRQVRLWQKRLDYELTVSVNLSARQFQQPDLVQQIRAAIDDTGVDPSWLQFEITESNAMQNAENTIHTLLELKALGVGIAMDDFGTGYSSLNYLKRFPIDTLKLDQSFVHEVASDPSDAAIVSAVIAMAHILNLTVVAEGVETEEQLAFLQKERCDVIQGYLFSAPLPAEELEPYLRHAGAGVA